METNIFNVTNIRDSWLFVSGVTFFSRSSLIRHAWRHASKSQKPRLSFFFRAFQIFRRWARFACPNPFWFGRQREPGVMVL